MEFSKLSHEVLRSLKVGDVVVMERSNAPRITAPIIEVEHRWGTDALPLVTLEGHNENWTGGVGEEVNFEACRQAGAHMILEIVECAPYRCVLRSKRNIFREHIDGCMARSREKGQPYWNYPRKDALKGQLCGRYREMSEVFIFALAKLPYELVTGLHDERAMKLWEKAGYPGLVHRPDNMKDLVRKERALGCSTAADEACNEHWFVHEKQFCRFVRQNWSKLVMTKAEMHAQQDEIDRMDHEAFQESMEEFGDMLEESWEDVDSLDSEEREGLERLTDKYLEHAS